MIVGRFCDRCLQETRAQSQQEERRYQLREELGNGRVTPVERAALIGAKAAHYRSGSFAELEFAMRELRRRQPGTAWFLLREYVDRLPTGATPSRRTAALTALSLLMPAVLSVANVKLTEVEVVETRLERNRRIIQLYEASGRRLSSRALARQVGVGYDTVQRVLRSLPPLPAA